MSREQAKMVKLLMERDLPGLDKLSKAISITATTSRVQSTNIPVSTSTVYVPEIVPPSPHNNPFIYHASNVPDGTVFIAVGAIVGAIFLGIFIWWCVTTFVSYRNTKNATDLLTQHNYSYVVEKQPLNKSNNNNRIISDSSSMGKSTSDEYELEEKYLHPSLDNANDLEFGINGVEQFNIIQHDNTNNYRNSLFISPTLQMQQQSNNNPYMTPRHNSMVSLDKPALTASPERKKKSKAKHKRNQSSLGLLSASPSKSAIDLSTTKGHRKSASVYLDNMLADSLDNTNI
ncbi:hypothetical protein MOUN0_B01112 [Monosporozyma unispora]